MTTRPFSELAAPLDARPDAPARRARAKQRLTEELAAHEASLAQLRRARRMTQVQLARSLEISQSEISRIEHQADLMLSTLRSYVEAMGGELQLIARFADEDEPVLLDVGDLTGASATADTADTTS